MLAISGCTFSLPFSEAYLWSAICSMGQFIAEFLKIIQMRKYLVSAAFPTSVAQRLEETAASYLSL